jgi:O-antigen/teichoic acid export membrane protein
MSERGGLAKDAFASMARHVATLVAGFVTIPILARMLGASRLGFWSLLGTAAFLLCLCDLGLNTATLRASAGTDPRYAKQVARLASLTTLLLAVPAVALCVWWLWSAALQLPEEQQGDARQAVLIGLGGGVLAAATQSFRSYAQGQGRIVGLAWARAAAVLVQLLTTISLLFLGLELTSVAIGFAVGAVVEASLGCLVARDGVRAEGFPQGEQRKEMVRVAGAAMVTNVSVILAVRADVLVLERITNLATIGAYSVAARLVDQGYTLVKQVSAALVPRLGKRATDRASSVRLGTMIVGVMAAGPLAAAAVAGRPILVLWAGEPVDLPILGVALAWLACAAMVASINEVALSAMSLGGDPMAAARFIAIGSVTNVALSIAGGFAFGPWAVAASTLAGNLVLAFLVWRWTRAAFRWDASTLGRTFLPVLIAIPTGAVFAFVCDVSGLHGLVSTVIGCLGALVVGGALLWRLRPVPEEAAA